MASLPQVTVSVICAPLAGTINSPGIAGFKYDFSAPQVAAGLTVGAFARAALQIALQNKRYPCKPFAQTPNSWFDSITVVVGGSIQWVLYPAARSSLGVPTIENMDALIPGSALSALTINVTPNCSSIVGNISGLVPAFTPIRGITQSTRLIQQVIPGVPAFSPPVMPASQNILPSMFPPAFGTVPQRSFVDDIISEHLPSSRSAPMVSPIGMISPVINMRTMQPIGLATGGLLPVRMSASPWIGQVNANIGGINIPMPIPQNGISAFGTIMSGLPIMSIMSESAGTREMLNHNVGQIPFRRRHRMFGGSNDEDLSDDSELPQVDLIDQDE